MRAVATIGGRVVESPWYTAEEAAAYLRFDSPDGSLHAFYLAYRRLGISAYRTNGGRSLRFHKDDLDKALKTARAVEAEEKPRSETRLPAAGTSNRRSAPRLRFGLRSVK